MSGCDDDADAQEWIVQRAQDEGVGQMERKEEKQGRVQPDLKSFEGFEVTGKPQLAQRIQRQASALATHQRRVRRR